MQFKTSEPFTAVVTNECFSHQTTQSCRHFILPAFHGTKLGCYDTGSRVTWSCGGQLQRSRGGGVERSKHYQQHRLPQGKSLATTSRKFHMLHCQCRGFNIKKRKQCTDKFSLRTRSCYLDVYFKACYKEMFMFFFL